MGKRVHWTNGRRSSFLDLNFEIVRMVRSQRVSFCFLKNISIVMILFRDIGKVWGCFRDGSGTGGNGRK